MLVILDRQAQNGNQSLFGDFNLNTITPSVHKMVKHKFKFLQQMQQCFSCI